MSSVRPARQDDIPLIASWTTGTFDWGDYVPDRLPRWIKEPDSQTLVCVDEAGIPIGVAHVVMLSPREAWLEGARVHPDHRRAGVGLALNNAGVAWARERGARVARLAIEAANQPARRQVEKLGYRSVSSWIYGELKPEPGTVFLQRQRLHTAPTSDVDPAWLFWSASDLAAAGRELISLGWRWRRARPDDLSISAHAGELYASPAGWVMVTQPEPEWMRIGWLVTAPEDAPALLDAIVDLGHSRGADVTLSIPNLPWTSEALTRAGASPSEILIYTKSV